MRRFGYGLEVASLLPFSGSVQAFWDLFEEEADHFDHKITAAHSVQRLQDLPLALNEALSAVEIGATYVLDVRIVSGYASAMPVSEE